MHNYISEGLLLNMTFCTVVEKKGNVQITVLHTKVQLSAPLRSQICHSTWDRNTGASYSNFAGDHLHALLSSKHNLLYNVLHIGKTNMKDEILPLPEKSNGVGFGNQDKHSPGTRRKACTGACALAQVVTICPHNQL